MIQKIKAVMKVDLEPQTINTNAEVYSRDKNSAELDIMLDVPMDSVRVLFSANNIKTEAEGIADPEDLQHYTVPIDYTWIQEHTTVRAYIYGKAGDSQYDIGVVRFRWSFRNRPYLNRR